MARARGGLSRAQLIYPDLDLSKVRLIGWGAGQAFNDYFPHTGLSLEYTVCPISQNQGRTIHGVKVMPPEHLATESPDEILVIIFSTFVNEVMHQIRNQFGTLRTMRAVDFGNHSAQIAALNALKGSIADCSPFSRSTHSSRRELGIFVQGPLFPYTPVCLAHSRTQYPAAYICLITWKTEDMQRLEQCRPWVDEIIELDPPEYVGHDTRNYIAKSCRAGSKRMLEVGVQHVVRLRSDAVITGSIYDALDRMYEDGTKNQGKIGILLEASWALVPFHFSDKLMVASAKDMMELWSVPEDLRAAKDLLIDQDAPFQTIGPLTWEHYLWASFSKRRGYSAETLEDSYVFAKELLLPLEPDMGMYSLKHLPLFDLTLRPIVALTLDWWNDVQNNTNGAMDHIRSVSAAPYTIRDFFQKKIC